MNGPVSTVVIPANHTSTGHPWPGRDVTAVGRHTRVDAPRARTDNPLRPDRRAFRPRCSALLARRSCPTGTGEPDPGPDLHACPGTVLRPGRGRPARPASPVPPATAAGPARHHRAGEK